MGRLLYDSGRVDEKSKIANERASSKIGRGSFSWAWQFDGTAEERERYVRFCCQSLWWMPGGLNLKLYKGYDDGHCRADTLNTTQEYHHT